MLGFENCTFLCFISVFKMRKCQKTKVSDLCTCTDYIWTDLNAKHEHPEQFSL